jgi:hypothetical protein
VFQYFTNLQKGSAKNPNPSNAVRLANGTTLIADQFNDRVFIISIDGTLLWQYGELNKAGNKPGELNAPYNAMSIGDYTGVTPPPGF